LIYNLNPRYVNLDISFKYIYIYIKFLFELSRHVKVSQPGSHGLAHHEPGSK